MYERVLLHDRGRRAAAAATDMAVRSEDGKGDVHLAGGLQGRGC